MTEQDDILALAQDLIQMGVSTIPWVRSFLVSGGASGTMSESQPPIEYTVRAAQLSENASSMLADQWWKTCTVRLMVAALDMPFDPEPSPINEPEVHFEDVVTWGGRTYRVTGFHSWQAPGGDGPPKTYLWFIGLGA